MTIQDLENGQGIEDFCDIFINATGILNNWKWPDISGLDTYKGTLLHTADWDENVKLDGKTVGLIGNGYVLLNTFHNATSNCTNMKLIRNSSSSSYSTDC